MSRLYKWLHIALPIQIIISWPLWCSGPETGRTFPLLPFFDALGGVPAVVSIVLVALLVAALMAWLAKLGPEKHSLSFAFAVLMLLVILDLNRLQVWVWMWMLLWVATLTDPKPDGRLPVHAWMIAGIYVWSGLNKLTPWFSTNFDWFCKAFSVTAPMAGNIWLSYASGIFEMLIGPALLFGPTRRVGIWMVTLLHVYILLVIGPLGLNYNHVVWPWNVAMIGLVWYFFNDKTPAIPQFNPAGYVLLTLVWVMPVCNIWGWWPESLSWKMYANTQREATIYSPEGEPCSSISNYWKKNAQDDKYLLIDDWTIQELRVPSFNSLRNYQRALDYLHKCSALPDSSIQLKILTVSRWSRDENLQLEVTY